MSFSHTGFALLNLYTFGSANNFKRQVDCLSIKATKMRKLILKLSVSLDGFAGTENGGIDWIFRTYDEEATKWTLDVIRNAGAHLMGSRTFYDMRSYWPYSNEAFAAPMNEIPKIVASKKGLADFNAPNLTTNAQRDALALMEQKGLRDTSIHSPGASWTEPTILTGDLAAEIAHLKQQPGKYILAHGGAGFARSLIKLNLVDEYQPLVHPIALGKGLPVFSALSKPMDLELVNIMSFKSGAAAHIYQPK